MLLIDGDQLPAMPLFEVVGNAGIDTPEQYGPTCVNVGVVGELITIVVVTFEA